jgi:hypothetical protein
MHNIHHIYCYICGAYRHSDKLTTNGDTVLPDTYVYIDYIYYTTYTAIYVLLLSVTSSLRMETQYSRIAYI